MLTKIHTVPGITTTYTKVNGLNTAKIDPLKGCISVASEFFGILTGSVHFPRKITIFQENYTQMLE